jgi:hypothetical protein
MIGGERKAKRAVPQVLRKIFFKRAGRARPFGIPSVSIFCEAF